MQRYLCILCLAATNKVIPVGGLMRQSKPCPAKVLSVPVGGSGPCRTPVCAGRGSQGDGDPGAIRTRDPRIRNPVLYPAELRGHPDRDARRTGEAPMCRATYVRSARAAISGRSRTRGRILPSAMIRSKCVVIRSKVDMGCMIHLSACSRHRAASAGPDSLFRCNSGRL